MIGWYWAVIAFIVGMLAGVFMIALVSANRDGDDDT